MKNRTTSVIVLGAATLCIGLGLAPTASKLAPAPAPGNLTAPAPGSTTEATEYQIDPVHSTSIFRVHHFGAGMFHGMFDRVTGTISYDPDAPESTVFDVAIDIESIHTGSEERNGNLNNHLKSPDFFNAKEFPQMTFKSTSVESVDDDTLAVTGDLTIHGVTKSVTANVDLTGNPQSERGTMIGFETMFTIDRTEYGMDYGVERGVLGSEIKIKLIMEGRGQ